MKKDKIFKMKGWIFSKHVCLPPLKWTHFQAQTLRINLSLHGPFLLLYHMFDVCLMHIVLFDCKLPQNADCDLKRICLFYQVYSPV